MTAVTRLKTRIPDLAQPYHPTWDHLDDLIWKHWTWNHLDYWTQGHLTRELWGHRTRDF